MLFCIVWAISNVKFHNILFICWSLWQSKWPTSHLLSITKTVFSVNIWLYVFIWSGVNAVIFLCCKLYTKKKIVLCGIKNKWTLSICQNDQHLILLLLYKQRFHLVKIKYLGHLICLPNNIEYLSFLLFFTWFMN